MQVTSSNYFVHEGMSGLSLVRATFVPELTEVLLGTPAGGRPMWVLMRESGGTPRQMSALTELLAGVDVRFRQHTLPCAWV